MKIRGLLAVSDDEERVRTLMVNDIVVGCVGWPSPAFYLIYDVSRWPLDPAAPSRPLPRVTAHRGRHCDVMGYRIG
jgi:hypothetical protein